MIASDANLNVSADVCLASVQQAAISSSEQLGESVAAIVRKRVPNSLPLSILIRERNLFIQTNKWKMFDLGGKGFLTFDEYLAMEWAGYRVIANPDSRVVTKIEFLTRFLGDPKEEFSGWSTPDQRENFETIYNSIDIIQKGFITIDDLRPRAMAAFNRMDKNHDGRLSRDELQ